MDTEISKTEVQDLADKMLDAGVLNASEHDRVGDILLQKNSEKNGLDYIIATAESRYADGDITDDQALEWLPRLGVPIHGGRRG